MTLLRSERRSISSRDLWARGEDDTARLPLAGERVGYKNVIGLDAVFAAVALLSDLISTVPFHGYEKVDGVGRQLDEVPQIIARPTAPTSAIDTLAGIQWRVQYVVSRCLWGNVYGLVLDTDELGYPTMVELLDPSQVQVEERFPAGRPIWRYAGQPVDHERIIHVPGRHIRPGSILGVPPLETSKETFGLALAARNYGARWFAEGAHPSAILHTDKAVDEPSAKTIKARFVDAMRRRREPAVLGLGIEYQEIQKGPAESQMLEVQRHMIGAVARAIGVPPEMIGGSAEGSSITYANREQRSLDLLTYYVDPWLVGLEALYTGCLPGAQYAKAARGAFLRTDMLTRYKAHDTAIRVGMRSPNEARAIEDEGPLPNGDGDVFLWPPYATNLQSAPPRSEEDE